MWGIHYREVEVNLRSYSYHCEETTQACVAELSWRMLAVLAWKELWLPSQAVVGKKLRLSLGTREMSLEYYSH